MAGKQPNKSILILSQVYVPDPASVGQHMHDAAAEMARRGWSVRVLTSARGYEDPSVRYPRRERVDGVDVRRLPLSSFGKRSIPIRLAAQTLFIAQAIALALLAPCPGRILVSTSPPMCSIAALVISRLRRAPIVYWVMDLNPDQVIAMGKICQRALSARVFDAFNRMVLRRAAHVVALDRFMAQRVNRKLDVSDKMSVMPPWPHEESLETVPHGENPFRQRHGLDGKFVVMYSGNHSPANPIDTVIDAAKRLRDHENIVFLFVGGGLGKKAVQDAIDAGATNIVSLPYQPMSELRYSLPAADVHVVTIGDGVVGIVHPCKVYGAMAVARPILFVGPRPSHVSDLIDTHAIGGHVEHGDVDGAVKAILALAAADNLPEIGARARRAVQNGLSKAALCGRFCDILEGRNGRPDGHPPAPDRVPDHQPAPTAATRGL